MIDVMMILNDCHHWVPSTGTLPHALPSFIFSTTFAQQKDNLDEIDGSPIGPTMTIEWHETNDNNMTASSLASLLQMGQSPPIPSYFPSPALKQIKQKLCCWICKDYTIDGPDVDWSSAIPDTSLGIIAPIPNPSNTHSTNATGDCVQHNIDLTDPYNQLVKMVQGCIKKSSFLMDSVTPASMPGIPTAVQTTIKAHTITIPVDLLWISSLDLPLLANPAMPLTSLDAQLPDPADHCSLLPPEKPPGARDGAQLDHSKSPNNIPHPCHLHYHLSTNGTIKCIVPNAPKQAQKL